MKDLVLKSSEIFLPRSGWNSAKLGFGSGQKKHGYRDAMSPLDFWIT